MLEVYDTYTGEQAKESMPFLLHFLCHMTLRAVFSPVGPFVLLGRKYLA